MTASDLEYLLKEKVVDVPVEANLYLFILDQAQALRNERPGFTISQIESSDDTWVGKSVAILPDPRSGEISKSIRIQPKVGLKPRQLKIIYFDVKEVEEF